MSTPKEEDMRKNTPLALSNPYCQNPEKKAQMLYRSAASSFAVEGIRVPPYKKSIKSKVIP